MSDPIRVLHLGDLHLGVELYGRPMPEKGFGTRVADFLASLEKALELAPEVDLILFPGDVYKSCEPSPTIQREFAARVRQAVRHAPVVIIPGNHDLPNAFGRASSVDIFRVLEVEGVHVLRQPEVETVQTRRGPVLMAPLPFMPRSRLVASEEARGKTIPEVMELMRDRLVGYIEHMEMQVEDERSRLGEATPAILMVHYTIAGAVFGGYGKGALLSPEVELPLGTVRTQQFDYVALGHIHKHQSIPPNDHSGQPPVVYPGSIERVDFSEEHEEKCVVVAEVARGRATWRSVPLSPRPFITLRIEADEADPLESVKSKIEAKKERLPGAVVRLIYTLPAGLPNLPERELRQALEPAAYIAAIRRETPEQPGRGRAEFMTAQLPPLQALSAYLDTKPELQPRKEELMERAQALVSTLNAE